MSDDWLTARLREWYSTASDPWQDLNLWLWRRAMLKDGVPRSIFDGDDPVLSETVKLVDVAIRDQVRTINKWLLAKGMPDLTKTQEPSTARSIDPYAVFPPKKRPTRNRERCAKCLHVNFTASCSCPCHRTR